MDKWSVDKEKTVQGICNHLTSKYKDYVLLVTLAGSAAHSAMYKGISDIDFVFITTYTDFKINEEIMSYIRTNYTNFKIDVSFTPQNEVKNEHCLNFKAMQSLFLIQKNVIKCLYKNSNFEYFISDYVIKESARVELLNDITEARRIVSDFDNWPDKENGQRKLLKTIYYAMKKFFIINNIFPSNLGECIKYFGETSGISLNLDFLRILRRELKDKNEFQILKQFCFDAANYILEQMNNRREIGNSKQDIRIKADVTYKSRAAGLVKHNNKFLFVNMDKSPYWCVPGGHIELFENSEKAAIREVEEETGMQVKAKKLFLIQENFYFNKNNLRFHELGFYYLVEPKKGSHIIENQIIEENDKGIINHLEFRWLTKQDIQKTEIKPTKIKELILKDKIGQLNHFIKRLADD